MDGFNGIVDFIWEGGARVRLDVVIKYIIGTYIFYGLR
jgi:hypothetical protein